jgi:hypothetical protein
MKIGTLLLICALGLSGTAAYYSIAGLATIFASAFYPVVAMASILEISKLVVASWLYQKWSTIPALLKVYLTTSVIILMFITSLGIFGFLSKAHVDAGLGNSEIALKIEQLDQEIAQAKDISTRYQTQLSQLDKAINIQLDANRAAQAMAARKQQETERTDIKTKLDAEQTTLQDLQRQKTLLRQQITLVESKLGPIKYIAEFFADGKEVDLDKAVRWMIVTIVLVFDPLAILMLIAANLTTTRENKTDTASLPVVSADNGSSEPKYGEMIYNQDTGMACWWTGSQWREISSAPPVPHAAKPYSSAETPTTPNIDPEIIKDIVTKSMDSWLKKTLADPAVETQPSHNQPPDTVDEPPLEPEIKFAPVETEINPTPENSEESRIFGGHSLDHFKPTHITYGRRI